MKKLLICIFGLLSCNKPSQECLNSSNSNFNIEVLFDIDGIRVYRFEDGGRSRYFASSGTVMGEYTRTYINGKSHQYKTYEDDIQTVGVH